MVHACAGDPNPPDEVVRAQNLHHAILEAAAAGVMSLEDADAAAHAIAEDLNAGGESAEVEGEEEDEDGEDSDYTNEKKQVTKEAKKKGASASASAAGGAGDAGDDGVPSLQPPSVMPAEGKKNKVSGDGGRTARRAC